MLPCCARVTPRVQSCPKVTQVRVGNNHGCKFVQDSTVLVSTNHRDSKSGLDRNTVNMCFGWSVSTFCFRIHAHVFQIVTIRRISTVRVASWTQALWISDGKNDAVLGIWIRTLWYLNGKQVVSDKQGLRSPNQSFNTLGSSGISLTVGSIWSRNMILSDGCWN